MADKLKSDLTEMREQTSLTSSKQNTESRSSASKSTASHGLGASSASSTYNAWPEPDSSVDREQIAPTGNSVVESDNESGATPLSSVSSSNSSDEKAESDEEIIEEYVPADSKRYAQHIQAFVRNLERHVKTFTTSARRQEELHRLLEIQDDAHGEDTRMWLAYLSRNPQDIPENPQYERRPNAKLRSTRTTFRRKNKTYNRAEKQLELFGDWSWPREDEHRPPSKRLCTDLGPKDEFEELIAQPPSWSTWQDVASEQRKKLWSKLTDNLGF